MFGQRVEWEATYWIICSFSILTLFIGNWCYSYFIMFPLSCSRLFQIRTWRCIRVYSFQCLSFRSTSTISREANHSFTVDYLVSSCGLSAEEAHSVAKKYLLKTPEKPDAVLAFLTSNGFSRTQIRDLVRKCPRFLLVKLESTLKPKIQFFLDLGFSASQLTKVMCADPSVIHRSLEKKIAPSINFLRSKLNTNGDVVAAIGYSPRLLSSDLQKDLGSNILFLLNEGVPPSSVPTLLRNNPRIIMQTMVRFKDSFMKVKKMGFNPCTPSMFIEAMHTINVSSSILEAVTKVYRSLGWSEMDVFSAFLKQPICMRLSEKKIRRTMDFYVNELNIPPSDLSLAPTLLLYSLERHIIPRCGVLQILASKNLLRRDLNISTVKSALGVGEKNFLSRYVIVHQDKVPAVLDAYYGKIEFSALNSAL